MQPAKRNRTEQGLTLIECLMGIIVITLVIAAITPPLLISMATRVRNYRAEYALKVAQGEIDRVRLAVGQGQLTGDALKSQLPPELSSTNGEPGQISAPNPSFAASSCPLQNPTGVQNWCAVDINGDNQWDLAVQTFRWKAPSTVLSTDPIAFKMGVRVYTRAALQSGKLATTNIQAAPLGLTSGQSVSQPIVYLDSIIVRSDLPTSKTSYCKLMNELNSTSTTCD